MPTLLDKLQEDAANPAVPVTSLLMQAKRTAVKLGLGGVERWIESEINGYSDQPPKYRDVTGQPVWHSNQSGWVLIENPQAWLRNMTLPQPLSYLQGANGPNRAPDRLTFVYPSTLSDQLANIYGSKANAFALAVSRHDIIEISNTVRHRIHDWALDLEKAGIRGGDNLFTDIEKSKAETAPMTINITAHNITGVVGANNTSGNISSSKGLDAAGVKSWLVEMRKAQAALIEATGNKAIASSLEEIHAEATKSVPDAVRMTKLIIDFRNAISGAAGTVVGAGVLSLISKLVG